MSFFIVGLVGAVAAVATLSYAAGVPPKLIRAYAWLVFALVALVGALLRLRAVWQPAMLALAWGATMLPIALADISKAHRTVAQMLAEQMFAMARAEPIEPLRGDEAEAGAFAYDQVEYQRLEAFRTEHDKHNGRYGYLFEPTSIAVKRTVTCSCGVSVDVSNYEAW